nr:MAG: replication associated protein [Cressdnaviricota sp.]
MSAPANNEEVIDLSQDMEESSVETSEPEEAQQEGASRMHAIGVDDEASDDAREARNQRSADHPRRRPVSRRAARDFRAQGKCFALTYPKCPVERAKFDEAFKLKFSPAEFASAREKHKDGDYHMHVFVGFIKRKNVQSARYFDVSIEGNVYHPNTQVCKDRKKWLRYISKDGDHGVDELGGGDDDVTFHLSDYPVGKRKSAYQDIEWSKQHRLIQSLKPVMWPVELICEGKSYDMRAPDPANKKRNWWIVAPPNAGKTRWINKTFAGTAIYCPRTGKYPYEGYADQQLIIYDDRTKVPFEEFSDVLNTWEFIHPVYGEVRFRTQDWKISQTRNVIVLSNKTIEESMPEEDWERMKKRFIQIINPVLIPQDEKSDEEMSVAQDEQHNASDFA